LQTFFSTAALPLLDLAVTIGLSLIIFIAVEVEKWLSRRARAEPRR
jgi:hypothetical protein